ncbi:protein of unknown function [Burkholderia multivorans]
MDRSRRIGVRGEASFPTTRVFPDFPVAHNGMRVRSFRVVSSAAANIRRRSVDLSANASDAQG